MLTCKELTELVTDYTEGRLPLGRRLQMELHLGMCRSCRTYLRQMKATTALLSEVEPPPLDDATRLELEKRLLPLLKKG